ncbi:MAG TPA: tRNA pseudouridine(13) synthase TruD [Gemmatales bacterium]|nr:tRNA pseudouridine(13) synthase TruD [Gemmatales bacterium]
MPEVPNGLLLPPTLITAHLPGIAGSLKERLEDFIVEEIPAYQPSGVGEHLYLWIEKRDMGAEYFQRQIAQRLNIPTGEIGTAGMKDRRAITRQWVSMPVRCEPLLTQLEGDGLTVLKVTKHGNKLRPGHLRGNRFEIVLRNVTSTENIPAIIEMIQQQGLPNYYGTQRFGRDYETLRIGWAMLHGERVKVGHFLRKLALSAVQSAMFNRYVSQRLQDGFFRQVLSGDVMGKWPGGGMFVSSDPVTAQGRFDRREIVHMGPMFGSRMRAAEGEARQREMKSLEENQLTLDHFHTGGKLLEGTRRHNLIYVEELQWSAQDSAVTLKFTLPAGAYATVLLAELMKTDSSPADGD